MNEDDWEEFENNSDDLTPEQLEKLVLIAIGELLNISASVAELQLTDESADDIYAICDIVADYYNIDRAVPIITEHEDGSFTTHYESSESEPIAASDTGTRPSIPGSIRTQGKPKFKLSDSLTPKRPRL